MACSCSRFRTLIILTKSFAFSAYVLFFFISKRLYLCNLRVKRLTFIPWEVGNVSDFKCVIGGNKAFAMTHLNMHYIQSRVSDQSCKMLILRDNQKKTIDVKRLAVTAKKR